MKEGHKERLEALASRKDDLLTLSEIGVDQIIVDEAQEFRKLSFATNMSSLRGVDPNGSQRTWDLYVKSRFVDTKNPGRALVLAPGTPITNTLGEMFTVQRLMDHVALRERGLHEFDAWASTFGDTSTELELQPSGKYRPVTRFAQFVNVPELIAMFRSFADVVLPEDLRDYVRVPTIAGGKRRIITAEPTAAFKAYQRLLDERITAIEERDRAPEPGDDILLSVITDGRHAAIDLRLVDRKQGNEETSSMPSSRTPSASGARRADTPIGVRTASLSRSPVGACSSSRISARSRSRPRAASPPTTGSGTNSFASACRHPRLPTCRILRNQRRSSACLTISMPARCASLSARPTRWAPASMSSFV
jgi:hypothetical protein